MIHPSPEKLRALSDRWIGQEDRLQRIAESILLGEDWTRHLRGLPHVEEIPPREGEAYGRDLRGADLRRHLHPKVDVTRATERDAALVASVTREAMRNNTPLPDASPFPADVESAEGVALALRRGDRFLLARVGRQVVGCVRWAVRSEFSEMADGHPYGEVSGLAVSPTHRRVGIGGTLVASAEWDVAGEGHDWALLRTTVELGLVPWYERLGYVLRRVRQLTYPEAPTFLDAVLTKRLAVIGRVQGGGGASAPAAEADGARFHATMPTAIGSRSWSTKPSSPAQAVTSSKV
jgi:ribosomal protein S18 acetylase RimI-like enzyme